MYNCIDVAQNSQLHNYFYKTNQQVHNKLVSFELLSLLLIKKYELKGKSFLNDNSQY